MLRSSVMVAGLSLVLGSFAAQARDFEKLLKGDYAFAGEATCLISFTGFSSTLSPNGPGPWPQVFSFSVQGVRTFNGDGTGKFAVRTVALSHPFALPGNPPAIPPVFNRGGASSADLAGDFTYAVSPDLKVTIQTPLVTGTALTGSRAGQTLSITNIPPFTGYISEDLQSLTLAHEEPGVEVHAFSNGDVSERICHRSRIHLERKSNKRRHGE